MIRWGGMRRLSGFLPVQSVYADFLWWTASGPTFFSRRTLNRPPVVSETGRDPGRLTACRGLSAVCDGVEEVGDGQQIGASAGGEGFCGSSPGPGPPPPPAREKPWASSPAA